MMNKAGILVLLMALSLLIGPASATTWNVNNTSDIQGTINNASAGDTINFTSDTGNIYTGVALTANKNNLKFKGNGVTLFGSGSSIFTISGTTGVTIKNFIININNTGADGITGSSVYNSTIKNNTITNGDDGINIFMQYGGLKIINNIITDMNDGRDGISLVDHNTLTNLDSIVPTIIKNNIIDTVEYDIFLGGNFKGLITGNDVSGTIAGLNITGKAAANNGKLNATICNNTITGGIAMESPDVIFLNLCHNVISQVVGTEYCIFNATAAYTKDSNGVIYVTDNEFISPSNSTNPVFDQFRSDVDTWSNNTWNGQPYPQ